MLRLKKMDDKSKEKSKTQDDLVFRIGIRLLEISNRYHGTIQYKSLCN